MSTTALAQTILTFAAIVGVGAVLRTTGLLSEKDAHPLNAVIIYVGLPAFVFGAVHAAPLDPNAWRVVVVAWLVFAAMLALGLLGGRFLRLPRAQIGAFALVVALGNTGYIGYPITRALLGPGPLALAVFYDVLGTVAALVFVGLVVAQRFGTGSHARVNPLREVLTFPAVIAFVVALATRGVAVPVPVSQGLALLANMVAPLVMLAVGLSLKPKALLRFAIPLAVVVLLRLVISPWIALATGSVILAADPAALRVAVLEAGMPSMMLSAIVADRFGLDTEFTAAAIFATTVLAAVTIPLVQLAAF